jgi:hypothetical protein
VETARIVVDHLSAPLAGKSGSISNAKQIGNRRYVGACVNHFFVDKMKDSGLKCVRQPTAGTQRCGEAGVRLPC